MTPFLMAVTRGAVESAKMLVDHGADIFATDNSLNSAVHLAITCKKPEMLKLLIEVDKDRVLVQMKDKDKRNVLHLACGQDNSEVFFCYYFVNFVMNLFYLWDERIGETVFFRLSFYLSEIKVKVSTSEEKC